MNKSNIFTLLKISLAILVIYVLLKIYILPFITSPQVEMFVKSIGPLGYAVIIIYTVFSHVFAPISGSPGVFLAVTLYGLNTGVFLLYIASLISSTINFWISRKYGRDLVVKFVGKKSMKEIDELVAIQGKQMLIVSRLFGFSIFEFISYASGLTKIKFKDYIIITAIASCIPSLVMAVVFRNIDFKSELGMTIWLGSLILVGIIFVFLIRQFILKKKSLKLKS